MFNDDNIPSSDEPQEAPGQEQAPVSGVALQAADGSLYFIPDRALETFRVSSTMGKTALQEKLAAPGPSLKAMPVEIPGTWFKNVNILR